MTRKVVVLGGGVGGLSAAQELVERGFSVEVYERRDVFGGKARSIPVPDSGTQGRKDLPGEHGFRFFPSFYRHLPDTMSRIPFARNPGGVADNLVYGTRIQIARDGQWPVLAPSRVPRSIGDWITAFGLLFSDVDLPPWELLHFLDRLRVLATSCPERRDGEYEAQPWWEFIGAERRSRNYQKYLGQGLTRSLVAMKAEVGSTRTVGNILLQLLFGLWSAHGIDRLLNGPTNEVWIDPWVAYLKSRGVVLHGGAKVEQIQLSGLRVAGVTLGVGGRTITAVGDYYVSALPVEIMTALVTRDLREAAPSLANLEKLQTSWMNGIQFYLDDDVRLVPGHTIYVDSPWALTSVSQQQFWSGIDLGTYGDGRVSGILSVDISEWNAPGIVHARSAMQCSAQEIQEDVWAQLKRALNQGPVTRIRDENLLAWFLDPDLELPNPAGLATNLEPLLINTAGSLQYRPDAHTDVPNLFLASDYVRTHTDLATMEAANEAARRAVNAILEASGSSAAPAGVWPLREPEVFRLAQELDCERWRRRRGHGPL